MKELHQKYLFLIACILFLWAIQAKSRRKQYVRELASMLEKYILSLHEKVTETARLRAWLHYFKAKSQLGGLLWHLGDKAIEAKEDPPSEIPGTNTRAEFNWGQQRPPIGVPRAKERHGEAHGQ